MENEFNEEQVDYDDLGEDEVVVEEVKETSTIDKKEERFPVENGKVPNTIFLSRFSPDLKTDNIKDFFSAFGVVLSVNISRFRDFAFVDFDDAGSAAKAVSECHHQPGLGSSSLICDIKTVGKKDRSKTRQYDRSGSVREVKPFVEFRWSNC